MIDTAESPKEAIMRGVMARALLNVLRSRDSVQVGVVLELQTEARGWLDHLVTLTHSLGIKPDHIRRTNGQAEFHIDRDHRIMFFNRRTAHLAARGYSLDALYAPANLMDADRMEQVMPALCVRNGSLELY